MPDTRVVPGLGESRQFSAEQRKGYQDSLDAVIATAPAGLEVSGRVLDGPVVDALGELSGTDRDLLVWARAARTRCARSCSAGCPHASSATPGARRRRPRGG